MGLTKQYLRYAPAGTFNVVGSTRSNVVYLNQGGVRGKLCAVGACEHVIIWDLRKGEKTLVLHGDKHEVTVLAPSPDKRHLAVGYSDGAVRVFDFMTGEVAVTFSGHKSAVTALNYDHDGVRLVSGAKDTDVIVWDIINESGLFRLKGHKGLVTQARFLSSRNVLITSSKDMFVKFWDLDTQHCFKTLVGHRTEVWDFVVVQNETKLITGSSDSELRIWGIHYTTPGVEGPPAKRPHLDSKLGEDDEEEDEEGADDLAILSCTKLGSILRSGRERVLTMSTDPTGRVLGCHGNDSQLELFRIQTSAEAAKKLAKKQKKARKKAKEAGGEEDAGDATTDDPTLEVSDQVMKMTAVKMSGKIRAFDCFQEQPDQIKLVALLHNNTVETCEVGVAVRKAAAENTVKLTLPGHRSDVRTVSFSSDNTALLSASAESLKVWNRATLQCIRTMKSDYALCSLFAPGDRHVVIGTKTGKLQVFDIAAGTLLETVDAHSGPVWSISLSPDKRGLVSGSADNEVKFWEFDLITDEEQSATSKRLTVVHTRTLKMSEDVLCVKYSPDQRLLAVSLLDNTVKVFFADTLKFFLSLYGHKLPVLCMDVSADSSLLVTGSADRNVKIWGLDFGDCHKSIFAHDDSIMCLQFVGKTHKFFTGGKDHKLKEWDADSFDHIQTLEGHHGELWSLAVSPSGNFTVTASHDKSLRLWEKTQEPLVLEEEKEMEREKEYEESIAQGEEPVIAGETNKEAGIAGKKTVETVKAAERLMEALELYKEEQAKIDAHTFETRFTGKDLPAPTLHPMLQAFKCATPARYVLETIRRIKSSEMEESLLVLPFSYVNDILRLLDLFIASRWEVELCSRCLLFLLRIHQGQITSNQALLETVGNLRSHLDTAVSNVRDTIGFNLAGLRFLKQQIEQKEEVTFFMDATDRFKQKKRKAKKRAILTLKT